MKKRSRQPVPVLDESLATVALMRSLSRTGFSWGVFVWKNMKSTNRRISRVVNPLRVEDV